MLPPLLFCVGLSTGRQGALKVVSQRAKPSSPKSCSQLPFQENFVEPFEEELKYVMGNMKLIYNNKELSPFTIMATHHVKNRATLIIQPSSNQKAIIIFLDRVHELTEVTYIESQSSLIVITHRLYTFRQDSTGPFLLEYKGKFLKNNATAEDYNITPYSTIRVIYTGLEAPKILPQQRKSS